MPLLRVLEMRVAAALLVALLAVAPYGCATRSGYASAHPDMDKQDRQALMDGRIRPGFDKEMVRLIKGKPSNVTVNETKEGSSEVWLYPHTVWVPLFGTVKSEYTYVYFEDDRVVKVHTVRGTEKYQERMEKAAGE